MPRCMIGIDLGTTNSLVAVVDGAGPRVLANELGEYLTPSALAVSDDGTVLVGRPAKDRLVSDPDSGRAFFKRDMGTDKTYNFGDRSWSPTECSAMVLQELKSIAEREVGTVDSAVISVPAYFNDAQRQATMEAARIASLKVDRLINEPTAAALAFGYENQDSETQVMVFDIGGGTFDVTVLEIFDNVIEVLSSGGISRLGGEDYTEALLQHLAASHFVESGGSNRLRLRQQVEVIKRRLSQEDEVEAAFADKTITISRQDFIRCTEAITSRLRPVVRRALRDAKCEAGDLEDILLVGGASRMSVIRDYVATEYGRAGNKDIDPDRVVALGAAVQASLCQKDDSVRDMVLTDVAPHSLGVEIAKELGKDTVRDGYFEPLIDRNTTVPVSRIKDLTTMHPKQDSVDIHVYQGEARMVADNTLLGNLKIAGLRTRDEHTNGRFSVRFTYDMNGLLEVEVTRFHNKTTERLIIEQRPGSMSEQDIKAAIARMAPLKIHQRDLLVNRARLERANRLYEDLQGAVRDELSQRVEQFEMALEAQDEEGIRISGTALDQFMEYFFQAEGERQDRF